MTVELKPQRQNANQHTERGMVALEQSIQQDGFIGAITVAADGETFDGSARLETLATVMPGVQPIIVETDGSTPVVVRRTDIPTADDPKAKRLGVAANRVAELNLNWDATVLDGLSDEVDLSGLFERDELDDLLRDLEPGTNTNPTDTRPHGALAERFIAPPFSVLDSRQGYWRDRKRAWLELGIQSELGRDDHLTFSKSAQPPAMYELKNEMRSSLGREPTWDEVLAEAERRGQYVAPGTSIFDPVLCEIVYAWFCPTAGHILDPFAGGSVRGVVAAAGGHAYTGIELRQEQVKANREQWDALRPRFPLANRPTWIEGDSGQVLAQNPDALLPVPKFDLMFSCPPYFNLEVYSDDPRDLSNASSYTAFLAAYRSIIAHSVAHLKPNRFAVFVISDVRDEKTGEYVGLLKDTIQAFEDAGAALYNEAVLLNQAASAAIRVGGQFSAGRKLGRTHQSVLIFFKGDASKIREEFPAITVPDLIPDVETAGELF